MKKKKKRVIDNRDTNLIVTKPEQDGGTKKWFFVYHDDVTKEVKRFEHIRYKACYDEYVRVCSEKVAISKKRNDTGKVTKKHKKLKKSRDGLFLNKLAEENKELEIVQMLVDSVPIHDIAATMKQRYDHAYQVTFNTIMRIRARLNKISAEELNEIVKMHTLRYEILFKKFVQLESDRLALLALKNKEAINGLHEEVIALQVNNFMNRNPFVYDPTKLKPEQIKRLKELTSKLEIRG